MNSTTGKLAMKADEVGLGNGVMQDEVDVDDCVEDVSGVEKFGVDTAGVVEGEDDEVLELKLTVVLVVIPVLMQ
jgi:hypothetical protein